ncbi:MAG: VTT domain-containing protein [bacterium]|nr:VTT domain-containing protein [bacterium]
MNDIISLLETYKYLILFPLAIIEGPILTVIAGFLVSLGVMNIYIVYAIVVLGDIIGDALYYGIGRFGSGFLHRHGHWIGITSDRLERTKVLYHTHHFKSVVLSKVVYGVGLIGMVVAGSLKMPYKRFMLAASLVSLAQSAILIIIGIFFGYAYVQIEQYLDDFAAAASVSVAVIILMLAVRHFRKQEGISNL